MEAPRVYWTEEAAFNEAMRVRRLNSLRRELGLEATELTPEFAGAHTVGLEVEMTWPQAFPSMSRWNDQHVRPRDLKHTDPSAYKVFGEEYDQQDKLFKPLLENTKACIPRVGLDAYWEFSFLPSKNFHLLAAEVGTLYEAGILREGVEYATHLTLAGWMSDSDAHVALYLLEKAGGTTASRLTRETGWSKKGATGGLRRRQGWELVGNDQHGIEFRSLVCTSPEQIKRVLELAQRLAAIIESQPELWAVMKEQALKELRSHGLPLKQWPKPAIDPDLWRRYAATLARI